jgi:hypothetical protein
VLVAIVFELFLVVAITYIPPLNIVFSTQVRAWRY